MATIPDPDATPVIHPSACPAAAVVTGRAAEIRERVLARLEEWVTCESPSGDIERLGTMADRITEALDVVGARIERIDAPGCGVHLLARVPGREDELAPVLVLAHMDTVHPVGTLASFPFRITDERAQGPGIYDMKAGIAITLEALHLLAEAGRAPRRPVELLVTCDEETGSISSRALIEEAARRAAAVLVPEPPLPGGAVKTARKGVATYRLRLLGRAAHAGVEPERGVNAAVELAHQILRLAALAEPAAGTTVNVGLIRGGTASNVVPAKASAIVDVRFATIGEGQRIDQALHALTPVNPEVELSVERIDHRPPLERGEGVVRLYRHACAVAAALEAELGEGGTGGGSDGCFSAALGVPTLDGLGVDGGGAHTTEEHILTSALAPRVALLTGLLETL